MGLKTRAAVHVGHGQPLVIDEVEFGEPGPGHVVVRQFASGVCHSQLHQLHNANTVTPSVLGHESTGVVVAKGRGVTHVREGDRVMVTWLPRNAEPGFVRPEAPKLSYRGMPIDLSRGLAPVFTWTDTTVVPQEYVVVLPDDVATDVTAIIGCAVMTGCGAAMNTARVQKGDSVAVFGVGGIGLCIVQAAANLGANPIIAIDLDDTKLDFATKFGATIGVNAGREDPIERVRQLTNGGADFAFDAIGVRQTMEQILPAVRPGVGGVGEGGTAVLVGVPQTNATIGMRDFLAEKHLIGSNGGSGRPDRDFPIYLRWFKEGMLPLDLLVTERYTLDQVNEACDALAQGRIFGRSIIVFDQP